MSNDLIVVAMLKKLSFFHSVVSVVFAFLGSFVWGAGDFFPLWMKITFSLVTIAIVLIPWFPDSWFVNPRKFEEREQN